MPESPAKPDGAIRQGGPRRRGARRCRATLPPPVAIGPRRPERATRGPLPRSPRRLALVVRSPPSPLLLHLARAVKKGGRVAFFPDRRAAGRPPFADAHLVRARPQ